MSVSQRNDHRSVHVGAGLATALCLLVLPACGAAATLCFEAELANELTFPFEIVDREGASGGLALTVPEGAGDGRSFARDTGTAICRVPLAAPGSYTAWLRVRWNGHCSNSVLVYVGKRPRRVTSQTFGRWHWLRAGPWKLPAGAVQVRFRSREDGIWIDQIVLTSEEFKPPAGPHKATVIPADPAAERPEPSVFLTSTSGAVPPLPPTDFKLGHKGSSKVRLDRVGQCVLRSAKPGPLVVWLRNNSLAEAGGKVVLSASAPVTVRPSTEQVFRIPAGVPLQKVTFTISPGAGMPRRVHSLFVRVHHKSGKVVGQRVRLVRPYQWLVTNAVACPQSTGIETPGAVEANLARGFPGPAKGLTWRLASESAITPFGLLDMRRAVADKTYVMAYAYTCVTSAEATEVFLDVRHDDMIRVWLNGAHVFTSLRCAPSVQTRKLIKVRLKGGENHLLVKLCQAKNYWEFGAKFLTLDKRPAAADGAEVAPLLKEEGGGE